MLAVIMRKNEGERKRKQRKKNKGLVRAPGLSEPQSPLCKIGFLIAALQGCCGAQGAIAEVLRRVSVTSQIITNILLLSSLILCSFRGTWFLRWLLEGWPHLMFFHSESTCWEIRLQRSEPEGSFVRVGLMLECGGFCPRCLSVYIKCHQAPSCLPSPVGMCLLGMGALCTGTFVIPCAGG